MYDEPLDERYRLKVTDGRVEILRYGESWLENPPGAKAWISAADRIEQLRLKDEETGLTDAEASAFRERLITHLTKVWDWPEDDLEAQQLATQLVPLLARAVRGTDTRVEALLEALTAGS